MTRPVLVGLVGALLVAMGLGFKAWLLDRRLDAAKAENAALQQTAALTSGVNRVLAARVIREAETAADWRDAFARLEQVEDDNACRSAAIDAALDILRARRARR